MSPSRRSALLVLTLFATAAVGACRRTYAVVPVPSGGYKVDTLRAYQNGNMVYVTFRFDTVTHTRTVYQTDTLWREGKQIIRDTVRLVRRDTVRITRVDTVRMASQIMPYDPNTTRTAGQQPQRRDTVRIVRVDTVRIPGPRRVDTVRVSVGSGRVDTVRVPVGLMRVDTVRISRTDTVYVQTPGQQQPQQPPQRRVDTVRVAGPTRVDTIRVAGPVRIDTVRVAGPVRIDTVRVAGPVRVDTVRVAGPVRVDTVRVATGGGRVDTVRVTRVDTVRIASGSTTIPGRSVRIPPGQMPPAGQCRLWIVGKPPGQQAAPVACDRVGAIPSGAFVLLNDQAWDMDVDWAAEQRKGLAVPAQIVALKR